ncbi:MAG: hypothetical protein IKN14_07525 [Clostridiales bacterium]|nr:hypothetical protein [Clostridiales bacterium]
MRSEERAGIVFIALLVLWGTLVTEPFRIFADLLYEGACGLVKVTGLSAEGMIGNTLVIILLAAVTVLLMLFSRGRSVIYLPCLITAVCLIIEIVRVAISHKTADSVTVSLTVFAALIFIMHLFRAETVLTWAADIYIISLPVLLFTGLVIMPLASKGGAIKKILYASRYQSCDLASVYNDLLALPAIVWGIAAFILAGLPVVYYSFYRRKG